jgi:hypothetical protein
MTYNLKLNHSLHKKGSKLNKYRKVDDIGIFLSEYGIGIGRKAIK